MPEAGVASKQGTYLIHITGLRRFGEINLEIKLFNQMNG